MANSRDGGRGKPPRHTQFQKGKSGNPKGRPAGAKNRNTIIREVLGKVVGSAVNGNKKRISVTEASLLRLSQKALGGDLKAIQMIMALWKESEDALAEERDGRYPFSDADRKVIDEMYARMKAAEG